MSWLVNTSTAAALAIGGWGLLGTVDNGARISVVETEIRRLERIENKVDWLIQERVNEYRVEAPRRSAPARRPPDIVPEAPAPSSKPPIPPQGARLMAPGAP